MTLEDEVRAGRATRRQVGGPWRAPKKDWRNLKIAATKSKHRRQSPQTGALHGHRLPRIPCTGKIKLLTQLKILVSGAQGA